MTVRASIARVLQEYPRARKQAFTDHPLAEFIRRDLRRDIEDLVSSRRLLFRSSAGISRWAETPWVALLDPAVTSSPQHGIYIVLLFDGSGGALHLSLNQGITEVYKRLKGNYRQELGRKAAELGRRLRPHLSDHFGPIDLGAEGFRSRGYEAASIVSTRYAGDSLPTDAELGVDIKRFTLYYSEVI